MSSERYIEHTLTLTSTFRIADPVEEQGIIYYKGLVLIADARKGEDYNHFLLEGSGHSSFVVDSEILHKSALVEVEEAIKRGDSNLSFYLTSPIRLVRAYTKTRLEELAESKT